MRGEVWMANFGETVGHEQAGTRPALILSADTFNCGPAELVIALPITSKRKRATTHVPVGPPEDDLARGGFVKCEDVRSISTQRLLRRIGSVSPVAMERVGLLVRVLLEL
jgi:mRNA interferase MazF